MAVVLGVAGGGCHRHTTSKPSDLPFVALPGGDAGIGFDDLVFDRTARRVLAPGGRTGNLYLLDPDSQAVTSVGGFAARTDYDGSHDNGTTSADAGRGLVFAIDRTRGRLDVVDVAAGAIVASASVLSTPDYVRYVAATGEVWVTELDPEQIEIFSIASSGPPMPRSVGTIKVPGGPEALIVDGTRGLAYTNIFDGATAAVDVASRSVIARWPNQCGSSRGLALDEQRGFIFVACSEGKATVLEAGTGAVLSTLSNGSGVDFISYSRELSHLYVPGSGSATMAVFGVSPAGKLSLLGTVGTTQGSHCVVADDRGRAWVCDQDRGQLLLYTDTLQGP